jgi:hypothetical protein
MPRVFKLAQYRVGNGIRPVLLDQLILVPGQITLLVLAGF